jgi:alkanesulfonate monooxygenase SsuD/methylene tetrahydromethanopterin reductase-like flavin-dependent oxidoreductase (luciferase family)
VPDRGLPVRFGWSLVPEAADSRGLVEGARLAERAGFDLIGIQDHWVEQLLPLVVEEGMDTFVIWPSESPTTQLQAVAAEVVPALREAVAAHRAG